LSTLTLLIIRHAEKPGEQWLGPGSNESGQPDGKSLVIRGWERAGAWAALFGADLGGNDYPKPRAIFAANPGAGGTPDEGPSRRPYETVSALSARLSLSANVAYALGQEEQLVTTLVGLSGVALVCWEHKAIAAQIVPRIPVDQGAPPKRWPGERYDAVLRFDRDDGAQKFKFRELLPCLLAGDSITPF
jgi:hypothetical protein